MCFKLKKLPEPLNTKIGRYCFDKKVGYVLSSAKNLPNQCFSQ